MAMFEMYDVDDFVGSMADKVSSFAEARKRSAREKMMDY